ncbi:hypothetical protein RFI_00619, partial [Reticulomyxa filosa]
MNRMELPKSFAQISLKLTTKASKDIIQCGFNADNSVVVATRSGYFCRYEVLAEGGQCKLQEEHSLKASAREDEGTVIFNNGHLSTEEKQAGKDDQIDQDDAKQQKRKLKQTEYHNSTEQKQQQWQQSMIPSTVLDTAAAAADVVEQSSTRNTKKTQTQRHRKKQRSHNNGNADDYSNSSTFTNPSDQSQGAYIAAPISHDHTVKTQDPKKKKKKTCDHIFFYVFQPNTVLNILNGDVASFDQPGNPPKQATNKQKLSNSGVNVEAHGKSSSSA